MPRCLFLFNISLLTAATVTWDGGGDGTSWADDDNWVGDLSTVAGDDVVIDIAANPIVQIANPLTLRSLNSEEDILFSGSLTLTGGNPVITAVTFSDQSILVSGGAVFFSADGIGSTINLDDLVSFSQPWPSTSIGAILTSKMAETPPVVYRATATPRDHLP